MRESHNSYNKCEPGFKGKILQYFICSHSKPLKHEMQLQIVKHEILSSRLRVILTFHLMPILL